MFLFTKTFVRDIILLGDIMEYVAMDCKSAMNTVNGGFPYKKDLNVYRGCEHGCKYCFAIYSHDYLADSDYFGRVYYKKQIIECLEKELSSPKWKKQVINLGGIADTYQPIEKELKIIPEILKLMIKYKNPIIISTKSKLILRDIDLINELSKLATVNIAFTITTADEELRKHLEPGASSSIERFKALNEIKQKTNAITGVHIMPIIPFLTDDFDSLNAIYRTASKVKADYVLPGTLYLRGKTRPYFLDFVKTYDIKKYYKIKELYTVPGALKEYKNAIYEKIFALEKRYNITRNYMKVISNKIKELNN